MNRLTTRDDNGKAYLTPDVYSLHDIINKLAEYEELEKQGLLLRLPCKVGDNAYTIARNERVIRLKIQEISLFWLDGRICTQIKCSAADKMEGYGCYHYLSDDIGKSVFLTKSAAEQMLAKEVTPNKIRSKTR
jgi:hypothetical protein